MAVVFFILMISSATLEAQRNENDKFFDLMTAIGEDFGGEFHEAEKALELDLNATNSFLERLHKFAIRELVTKVKNGEFACKEATENSAFKEAIKTILGQNMRNLLKAIVVPKQSKTMIDKNRNQAFLIIGLK
uniref:Secreted protein n=1 Tax=Globodera rostochiensis TaxID=31243 RepID=A0A914H5W0_GLORO